jgi:hypothetical protein
MTGTIEEAYEEGKRLAAMEKKWENYTNFII